MAAKPAGIDTERNYVTVTLCIANVGHLPPAPPPKVTISDICPVYLTLILISHSHRPIQLDKTISSRQAVWIGFNANSVHNIYIGPPYSRMSRGSSCYRSISAARARPTSAANPPAAAAAVERRDRRTTDGRTLDRFNTFTAYYADREIS